MLVGISGKIGAGKDTIADSFVEQSIKGGVFASKFRFGDEVKDFCWRHLGLDIKKMYGSQADKAELCDVTLPQLQKFFQVTTEDFGRFGLGLLTYRQVMQFVGGGLRRVDVNCWVRPTFEKIYDTMNLPEEVAVVSDVRYKTEADYLRSQGGKIVRLTRFTEWHDNDTETDMDDYLPDLLIDNQYMTKEVQQNIFNAYVRELCKQHS